MNEILSICIPTFNRAEILKGCLENLIPQARKHNIPIYISDNASTDNTKEIVSGFQSIYQHIYYSRNIENIEDRNFIAVLKRSKSRYAWLISDKVRVYEGTFDVLLGTIDSGNYDLLILNTGDRGGAPVRVLDIKGLSVYDNANKLLKDLGWHMDILGSSVWSSNLINNGDFKKYETTNFIHFAVVFDYFAKKEFKAFWLSKPSFYTAYVLSGWQKNALEMFMKNWSDVVRSLPDVYSKENKGKCIKDHGVMSGLFSLKGFVVLRSYGYYDLARFKKYSDYFDSVTNVPKFVLFLVAIAPPVPMFIVKLIKTARDKMRFGN
jgi:glycosyltransferase involved in cell wall biosynthesis